MPVPNNAISNALLRKFLFAPDSSSWSCIFFCIFLAAIIAGLNSIAVGVLPGPSFNLSCTPSSFSSSGPSFSDSVLSVAPGGKSFPSPLKPYGLVSAVDACICSGSCGSKCTSATTPSGSVVGSIDKGNLLEANKTSTI